VGELPVVTALRYEGRVRRVILALKEQDRTYVAAALSEPLAAAIARSQSSAQAELAIVPTSRRAYRRRGYDPVALLLRHAGLRPKKVLRPARSTARQKTLGATQRAANLRGALVAAQPLTGRSFVLVDDVLTTGATLGEAARAITAAGGEVLGAATLAFTPRLFSFRDNARGQD
jgi:predicted amidophosphoribosyltransferase